MSTDTTIETSHSGVPIAEAAEILGISLSAARKRVTRGSLDAHKGEDGLWYVTIPETTPGDKTKDMTRLDNGYPLVIETLKDEVAFLRQELERRSDELRQERESRAEADRRRDVLFAQLNDHLGQLSTTTSTVQEQIEAVAHEVLPSATMDTPLDTPGPKQESWWRRLWYGRE